MYIEGTTGINMLTTLLTEVSDTNKKISKTIIQQLFLIDRALINDIIILQLSADKLKASLYLDKIRKQLAEIRLEINKRLIPHLEEFGDLDRLRVITDVISILDRLELLKARDIKQN